MRAFVCSPVSATLMPNTKAVNRSQVREKVLQTTLYRAHDGSLWTSGLRQIAQGSPPAGAIYAAGAVITTPSEIRPEQKQMNRRIEGCFLAVLALGMAPDLRNLFSITTSCRPPFLHWSVRGPVHRGHGTVKVIPFERRPRLFCRVAHAHRGTDRFPAQPGFDLLCRAAIRDPAGYFLNSAA